MISIRDIEAAQARIAGAVYNSPCAYTDVMSERFGCQLYLKLENLQMTGSFKDRGACNKLRLLSDAERLRGVVAASAGNHAQAVAYHARKLGIAATIVMPITAPLNKVSATKSFGARVILQGSTYDEAYKTALEIQRNESMTFVHAFNDDAIIAGQGTIGLELLEQVPDLDIVISCVGGGGLAAGIAVAIKHFKPDAEIYGVEPARMPSMKSALSSGEPTTVPPVRTVADGAAIGVVGEKTFALAQTYLDDVITVDDEVIAEAILLLMEREKTVAEGAGALAVAGLIQGDLPVEGKKVVAIVSGGNIDVNLISRIIERGLTRSGRLARFKVIISDSPGSLAVLLKIVGAESASVLQISQDRMAARVALGQVAVELTLETRGFEHAAQIEESILNAGLALF